MIPFLDLGAQYRELKPELDAAIARIWETSQFILGDEVAAFEEEFAAYSGAAFGVAVNSGTSALHLALLAAGIGPGDEVITVPFTFYATVAAIDYTGAKAVFVDVDPRTFNIDVSQIESRITARTRAILLVHLYGQAADMDPILEMARRHKLVVIEDAAQAHGAEYQGRRVGSIGDIGCFSFYPTKNLGAAGEGGMAVTNNPEFARSMRILRDWGQEEKYRPTRKGFNYRLPGMQGAILRVKLRRLEAWTEARRSLAAEYDRLLAGSPVVTPLAAPDSRHVYCLYTVRTPQRELLQGALKEAGIGSAIHYPVPIHRMPAYDDGRYGEGDFPVSEECSRTVLSLPLYPHLEKLAVQQICEVVNKFAESRFSDCVTMSTVGCPPARSPTSTIAFSGISAYSSDFQTILSRQVSIANLPVQQLQNRESDNLQKKSLLISLGTAVGSLATSLSALASDATNKALSATSSDTSVVTVTNTGASSAGSYTISNVSQLASAAVGNVAHGVCGLDQRRLFRSRARTKWNWFTGATT